MSEKVENLSIEGGDSASKPKSIKALEKIGRFVVDIQERESQIQRIAQNLTLLDDKYNIPMNEIQSSIAEFKADPIIPEGYFEKTQEYQQKSLEVLQSINENTANLYTMVELINQNNEKQDELIALMTDILSLAKAKSKVEADSLFKKIMGKINDTADNVEAMIKIVGWATTVYNMVLPLLP